MDMFPNPFRMEVEPADKFVPDLKKYVELRLKEGLTEQEKKESIDEYMGMINQAANLAAMGAFLEIANKSFEGYDNLVSGLRKGVTLLLLKTLVESLKSDKNQTTSTKTSEDLNSEAEKQVEELKRRLLGL